MKKKGKNKALGKLVCVKDSQKTYILYVGLYIETYSHFKFKAWKN